MEETKIPTWLNELSFEIEDLNQNILYHSGREKWIDEIQFNDLTLNTTKYGVLDSDSTLYIKGKLYNVKKVTTRIYTDTNNIVISIKVSPNR